MPKRRAFFTRGRTASQAEWCPPSPQPLFLTRLQRCDVCLFRGYLLSFSVIFRHVSQLSYMGVLSWRTTGQGKLMLTFNDGPVEKAVRDQAADAAPEPDDLHAEIPGSRILKNENRLSLFNLLYIIFNF